MSNPMPEQSTRRVLWWARNFGHPLQDEFAINDNETPDDFTQLLEMADKRLNPQREPPAHK